MTLPKGGLTRLDIEKAPFVIFGAHPDDFNNIPKKSKNNIILYKIFYHPQNIKIIQNRLIVEVFRKTKGEYLIEQQSESDIKIVMDSIYRSYNASKTKKIKEHIKILNDTVIKEIVPGIISEIRAHFNYLNDIFGPRKILDLPINTSIEKNLPSVSQLW